MNKKVIIIGASGHGKVVADIALSCGDNVLGFLDDGENLPKEICGIPFLGKTERYTEYPDAEFIIAIGNAAVRKKLVLKLQNVKWYTAIHPTAVISEMGTSVGEGTVIMANAVVNPCAEIGKHCIVNTSAVVEHDNKIGDFVHVSVGAKLAGTVSVGDNTWIGIGAVVRNNIEICSDCTVGAGAVVVKNIRESGTYIGVPARKVR